MNMTRHFSHKIPSLGTKKRLVVFIMLPVILVVWMIGWSFYYFGRRRDAKCSKKK